MQPPRIVVECSPIFLVWNKSDRTTKLVCLIGICRTILVSVYVYAIFDEHNRMHNIYFITIYSILSLSSPKGSPNHCRTKKK